MQAAFNLGSLSFVEVRDGTMRGLVESGYAGELNLPKVWDALRRGESLPGLRENQSGVPGRGEVFYLQLPSGSRVVVRFYRRGGFFRRMLRELFFRNPFTSAYNLRPLTELQVLAQLRHANVSVPTPVAALVSFGGMGFSYQGMIVTTEIEQAENLLSLVPQIGSAISPDDFRKFCRVAGIEASRMLACGVYHSDLHLGNVLLQRRNECVYLIDFDKAERFVPDAECRAQKERLLIRWQRSARKHGVEKLAEEAFRQGLEALGAR